MSRSTDSIQSPRTPPPPVPSEASVKDLREAVLGLATSAAQSVAAVRKAFTDGIPPLQTVSAGSSADFIKRFGGLGVAGEIISSTSRLGLSTSVVGTTIQPPKPEIDFVEVESDRTLGILDSFHTRIVISLSIADAALVSYVRILRSSGGKIDAPHPAFSAMKEAPLAQTSSKISDPIAVPAIRAAALGVGNKLTLFVNDDKSTKVRSVTAAAAPRPSVPRPNTNRGTVVGGLISITGADQSILTNLQLFLNSRSFSPPSQPSLPLIAGARQGINVLKGVSVATAPSNIVEVGNSSGFREITRLQTAQSPHVGDFIEIEFIDRSVIYGNSYTYYCVCQSVGGVDGPRSRLVSVDIVRRRPLETPHVLYSTVASRPRFSVRCSGSYVDHVEVFRRGGERQAVVRVIGSDDNFIVDVPPSSANSGFEHICDLGVGSDKSITFVDRHVLVGQSLDYRFYAVDSFGTKSQTPFSCSINLPDARGKIPLSSPSITAEQAGARNVAVSVQCDDPRVMWFAITRRESGNSEHGFHTPMQPDHFTLGTHGPKNRSSTIGSILQGTRKTWKNYFAASSGSATMTDTAVGFDRSYQYSVVGIDVRGNMTSPVQSQAISVSVKPVSEPPTAVTASVIFADDGLQPTGVMVGWSAGTHDFSPNELVGDQDVLNATSVRSVFQVERRPVGGQWQIMPAVTGTSFLDPVSSDDAPKFRPPFVIVGAEYDYRVISMQSGGFISTHTEQMRVLVAPAPVAPQTVWARSPSLSVRPAKIIV